MRSHSQIRGTSITTSTYVNVQGGINEWTGFWEQFDQTITLKNDLTCSIKPGYLKSFLDGDAAIASVSGLPTHELCYVDASAL